MTTLVSESPPIREDASGALRVGSSRVLVELVIEAFRDGSTPEQIVQNYPSTALADIYAVIAYYLRHPAEMQTYIEQREAQAEEVRQKVVARQGDLSDIRQRMAARRI